MSGARETAYAKINLALHVRGKRPDGRHEIETIFAFCADGDEVSAQPADDLSLRLVGPFAPELEGEKPNSVEVAATALSRSAGLKLGAALLLDKRLPVASGVGGGSADAAAALRLLTGMWGVDPGMSEQTAPGLGADVPACLLSQTCRGSGAGDLIEPMDLRSVTGCPVLLVNPRVPLQTRDVFARWDGVDRGPLEDWRYGRNDLEAAATALVPQIAAVLAWLSVQAGAESVRMSGSGSTCFALFATAEGRDRAAQAVPREWWHLASHLR